MNENDETTWADLEAFFGEDISAIIDRAISKQLGAHRFGIKCEDYYLVSEGLSFAVLTALRDQRLRVEPMLRAVR